MTAKTPAYLQALRGNPSKRRVPVERQPDRGPGIPEPPSFLSEYAREEWTRVAPSLWHTGSLTVLDIGPLCVYCSTYARWRSAEEALAQSQPVVEDRDGAPRANPLVRVARDAGAEMVKIAGMFGMSPAGRARIAAGIGPQERPPSKFDGLLAE
jgi:P27 family predicted phage terminase small subunit